jgi:Mlc titration factor MtfA (ptsG expression regulator)
MAEATRAEGPVVSSEEHPLDAALGDIHEIALLAQMHGMTTWANKLAAAYEKISQWVIDREDE